LNWQIKDGDQSALKLKKYLVKKLDTVDVRTYGLSFAIKSGYMNVSSSVIIEKKLQNADSENGKIYKYNLSYSEGFNPNNQNYKIFAEGISKFNLLDKIIELCKFYYEQLNNEPAIEQHLNKEEKDASLLKKVHQCSHCLSIYDELYGDPVAGIEVGVHFSQLLPNYCCSTCDNSKEDFVEIEIQTSAR
jgi:rubredoxin